jgi:hypothetical protein
MNLKSRRVLSAYAVLTPLLALGLSTAYASAPQLEPGHASAGVHNRLPQARPSRAPLDLRVPSLQRVMSRRQLEEASTADESEAIRVVAASELMPMTSDSEVPLGIVGSLQWTVNHPTQSWRLLFPSTMTP